MFQKVALFGSYARNEQIIDSDIDVLVSMPSSFDNYFCLKKYLEQNLGKEVDLGLENSMLHIVRKSIEDDMIYV